MVVPGCGDVMHAECVETFERQPWVQPMWPCHCPRGVHRELDEFWTERVMPFPAEPKQRNGVFDCVVCKCHAEDKQSTRVPGCGHMLHLDCLPSLKYLQPDGKWPCGCQMPELDECAFCKMKFSSDCRRRGRLIRRLIRRWIDRTRR